MPAFWRIPRTCLRCSAAVSLALISTPSISMLPADGSSRKLMQRRKVLFPPPEGPIITTTSRGATSRSTPLITCSAPKYLCKPLTLMIGSVIFLSPLTAGHVLLQPALEVLEDYCEDPVKGGGDDKGLHVAKVLAADLLRPVGELPD